MGFWVNVIVMAALEYVTKDGDVSVLGAAIIAESYIAATARAQAAEGRAEERKREQKKAGTYVIVRGIGAIDDSNMDAHADAMQVRRSPPYPPTLIWQLALPNMEAHPSTLIWQPTIPHMEATLRP